MLSEGALDINPVPFEKAGFVVHKGVSLSRLGTFQLGGPLHSLVECQEPGSLRALRRICHQQGIQALLIGEGSNLLFSDEGWPGMIVRYVTNTFHPISEGMGRWRVSAAVHLQKLVEWAVEEGWAGVEAFSGIPGTLGGAVVGNAGAWGVQMEHVLTDVTGIDGQGNLKSFKTPECGFCYRDSTLKHEDFWVSEVILQLQKGCPEELKAERARILELRAGKHPDWQTEPCIGSFFKNLEPTSAAERRQAAGYFLEQAGAKDKKIGGAAVYPGHANILIKKEQECKAADVAALARELQTAVKEMHGIDLVREVRYLGSIPGEQDGKGFY